MILQNGISTVPGIPIFIPVPNALLPSPIRQTQSLWRLIQWNPFLTHQTRMPPPHKVGSVHLRSLMKRTKVPQPQRNHSLNVKGKSRKCRRHNMGGVALGRLRTQILSWIWIWIHRWADPPRLQPTHSHLLLPYTGIVTR